MKKTFFTLIIGIALITGFFGLTQLDVFAQGVGLVSQSNQVTPGIGSSVNQAGNQVVTLLRNLSTITLDDAVFRNPGFNRLQNQTIGLPVPASQGRRNPFAPASGTVPAASSEQQSPTF